MISGKNKLSFFYVLIFFLTTYNLQLTTVFATPGDSGGIILEEPVAVRAVGLGEAYTALSEGAAGSFWNPAGLSYQNLFILETGMMTGYDAAGLITMGFARPLKSGGAFAVRLQTQKRYPPRTIWWCRPPTGEGYGNLTRGSG